jgi:hypothetical protein
VWEHGEKIGFGFRCKYCHETKNGGGATRLKYSSHSDTHVPNKFFTSIVQQHGDIEDVHKWVDTTVGDTPRKTHLVKRKTKLGPLERKGKMVKFDDEEEGLRPKKAQLILVKVMVATMIMVEVMQKHMVLGVVVQEGVVRGTRGSLETVSSPMPPKIQHLIHNERQEVTHIIRFVDQLMMVAIAQSVLATTILLNMTKTYMKLGHHHPGQYHHQSYMSMDKHLLHLHMDICTQHPILHMNNHFMVSQT